MKNKLVFVWLAVVCVVGLAVPGKAQDAPKPRLPVIDMHLLRPARQRMARGAFVHLSGYGFRGFRS